MRCPKCKSPTIVVDSRRHSGNGRNNFIRRRRECDECRYRFTTYERIDTYELRLSRAKPLHEVLRVEYKYGKKVRADAKALPGTPPVGLGDSKIAALYDLLAKIIWEWETWGSYVQILVKNELDEVLGGFDSNTDRRAA